MAQPTCIWDQISDPTFWGPETNKIVEYAVVQVAENSQILA